MILWPLSRRQLQESFMKDEEARKFRKDYWTYLGH
jgi:hypothetical protein